MRVVFLGNAEWSVASLESLAASRHEIAVVATRVPRPAGRGSRPTPTPVAEAARRLQLPLKEIETVRSGAGFEALAEAGSDVLAVVAYGEILPRSVLDLPRVAPGNVHFSLLPALRGAAPVQRVILEGLDLTGVTTIRMDAGMDTGPILLQRSERIRSGEDAGSLGGRLACIGGDLLVETLDGLDAGTIRERPQDHERATYAPKLTAGDRAIDWHAPEAEVLRRIRALAPQPGAETRFRAKNLKVHTADAAGDREAGGRDLSPGEVLVGPGQSLIVGTAGRPVRLDEVSLEGRNRMSGAELVRGYRPERGELLG